MQSKMERRIVPLDRIEVRQEDGKDRIVGHAAVFDVIGDGGWFKEKVARGAFTKAITRDDPRALYNHDPNFVLGRKSAGTLLLHEDETGLYSEIIPPDTSYVRDLKLLIERKDVREMSFAFETIKDSWERKENGEPNIRTIEEVRLWDVSVVTFPFYNQTDVALRSFEAWRAKQKPDLYKLELLKRKLNLRRCK